MQFNTLKSVRLAAVLGFFTSLAIGCVIGTGQTGKTGDCPEINNHLEGDECFCNDGYTWCDSFDDNDLTCCEIGSDDTGNGPTNNDTTNDTVPTGGTGTDSSNSDPTSGTTEEPPTSGTTGGPPPTDCVVEQEPPASCDTAMGELYLCLSASDASCEFEGSKYYICEGGVWVEDTMSGDASCKFDLNSDDAFSYGCALNGDTVEFVCGIGPGTACNSDDDATCINDKDISYCLYGKLTADDCLIRCMDVGDDMMITYDHGYCGEQDASIVCICCDDGDPGCPINEGTSSSGGESSTGGGSSSTG